MVNKVLTCAIFMLYFHAVALCYPVPNLFRSFNVIKIETPFRVGFQIETSIGSQNILKSLSSGTHSNRFDIIPGVGDKSNIVGNNNRLTVKPKYYESFSATTNSFKGKTISTVKYTTDEPFNGDNSVNDVNTETDSTSITNNESTTDFTTTEDYETTTVVYEEEVLNRSGVSPEVLASLLG